MVLPQYNRQVRFNPNVNRTALPREPSHIDNQYEPADRAYIEKIIAIKERQHKRERQHDIASTVISTVGSLAQYGIQYAQQNARIKANEAATKAEIRFQEFMRERIKDPDYEGFDELYQEFKRELQEGLGGELGSMARQHFDSKFSELDLKYSNQIGVLGIEKEQANMIASLQFQYAQAIEKEDLSKVKEILYGTKAIDFTIQEKLPEGFELVEVTEQGARIRDVKNNMHQRVTLEQLNKWGWITDEELALKQKPKEDWSVSAVDSGYILPAKAREMYAEAEYEITKRQTVRGVLGSVEDEGYESVINALETRNEDGEYAVDLGLRQEDRVKLVDLLNEEWSNQIDQQKRVADKKWDEGLDMYRQWTLNYPAINKLREEGLDADRSVRLFNMVDARVARAQKEKEIQDAGTSIDPTPFVSEVRRLMREGYHEEVVEGVINHYTAAGVIGNKEETLHKENRNRDKPKQLDLLLQRYEKVAKTDSSAAAAMELFEQRAESLLFDSQGRLIDDPAVWRQISEYAENDLIVYERNNLLKQFSDVDMEEVVKNPSEYANEIKSIEEYNSVISKNLYPYWTTKQREHFGAVKPIFTEYLTELYDMQRRDAGRSKLDRKDPVSFIDGVRPVFLDRDGNQWVAETKGPGTFFVPYVPETNSAVGTAFTGQAPNGDTVRMIYTNGRWYTDAELLEMTVPGENTPWLKMNRQGTKLLVWDPNAAGGPMYREVGR